MKRLTIREIELVVIEPTAETVLANLEWLIRNRGAVLDMKSETVFVRDGGYSIECLFQRGFTPATRDNFYYFGGIAA